MRTFVQENSLSIFFGLLFLAALVGQSVAGLHQFNAEQYVEGLGRLTWWQYVTSVQFAVDVAENWQSEYLQFLLYIITTVWLVQKGSPESKELGNAGRESEKDQKIGRYAGARSPRWASAGGWRTGIFSSSLVIVMGSIFMVSWLVQSVAGWAAHNQARLERLQDPMSWMEYLGNADFWSRTLQNWQSEFLAVGSMVVLSIYLRQRGSPESKLVGSSHEATGIEG